MRAVLSTILIHYPSQHLSTPVVVKIGINIRQIHTVGIQETLEKQVVFQRIYFRNTQAIGHH